MRALFTFLMCISFLDIARTAVIAMASLIDRAMMAIVSDHLAATAMMDTAERMDTVVTNLHAVILCHALLPMAMHPPAVIKAHQEIATARLRVKTRLHTWLPRLRRCPTYPLNRDDMTSLSLKIF
jgi:hypothetical protein